MQFQLGSHLTRATNISTIDSLFMSMLGGGVGGGTYPAEHHRQVNESMG